MTTLQHHVSGQVRRRQSALSVPEKHQLKIARQTMKLSCAGALILGGMNHHQAARAIHQLTSAIVGIDSDCNCPNS